MIETSFRFHEESGEMEMEARGHAGAGQWGTDPVCAGVSGLVMSLAGAVEAMGSRDMLEPRLEAGDGFARIAARVKPEYLGEALMAFWTVQMGIGAIAQKYPEHVKLDGVLAV